jgi:hypothetical protein
MTDLTENLLTAACAILAIIVVILACAIFMVGCSHPAATELKDIRMEVYCRELTADMSFPTVLMMGYDRKFNVQEFMEKEGCCLAHVKIQDKMISQWIDMACFLHDVNQRFYLAYLEYEQSVFESTLVGDDWLYPDGKSKKAAYVFKTLLGVSGGWKRTFHQYYGCTKQIELAAQIYRREFDRWRPGFKVRVHRHTTEPFHKIEPRNAAAFSLYMYTPYLNVISEHQRIYKRLFSAYYSNPFGGGK